MMKSMTGFGRCEHLVGNRKVTVEIKAVNHRYFDVNIKIPRKLGFFETEIRSELKKYVQRGKLDVSVTYEDFSEETVSLKYNAALAAQYLNYFRQIGRELSLPDDMTVSKLGRCPEVFVMEEQDMDEKELWDVLEYALRGACEQLSAARIREGKALQTDILDKLKKMDENVSQIEERYPQVIDAYRQRLQEKVSEVLADTQLEESRVAAEVVLYADKLCTDEETVRLHCHISSMKEALSSGDGVGRKLDFIAQEMNREANTILSKANDLVTTNIAIDLKTDIEKIREQVQNVE